MLDPPRADYGRSIIADGEPDAMEEIKLRTRLFHEIVEGAWPTNTHLRWFADGLFVVIDAETPTLYEVPIWRIQDLLISRPSGVPYIRKHRP